VEHSNPSVPRKLPAAGAYRLTIRLWRPVRLSVGRLGRVSLPAGAYYYCGSARANLPARVARHLRRAKKAHWHIDHLLGHPAAEAIEVRAWTDRTECDLAAQALGSGGRAVAVGFGSSDCRRGCPAHLIYMGKTHRQSRSQPRPSRSPCEPVTWSRRQGRTRSKQPSA